jgi:hypothetical protein
MTTENALSSQGVCFAIGDGTSPEVFAEVAEVTGINAFTGSMTIIDATHLKSVFNQKLAGTNDEGQVTLELNFYPGNQGLEDLEDAREDREKGNYRILVTDVSPAEGYEFTAFVTQVSYGAGVNEKQSASVTLEITGGRTRL